jgi:Anti-sigma factor NepR
MKQPKSATFAVSALLNEADTKNDVTSMGKVSKQVGGQVEEPAERASLDPDIQRHIGRKLKASYEELIKQPVPDKFKILLEELQRKEKKQ